MASWDDAPMPKRQDADGSQSNRRRPEPAPNRVNEDANLATQPSRDRSTPKGVPTQPERQFRYYMSERRPPGFNVILGFYDSAEANSIPRKIRAAAIGMWALTGNYCATQLTDGYVSAEKLRDLGCTPAIRAALMATLDEYGNPSPLWIDADTDPELDCARDSHGIIMRGIQFTRWPKHQRTRAEVKQYREDEATRKRAAREAAAAARAARAEAAKQQKSEPADPPADAHVSRTCAAPEPHVRAETTARADTSNTTTSKNAKMSGRTNGTRPQNVRRYSGQSESESESEVKNSSYVSTPPYETNAREERPLDRAGRPAMDLSTIANGTPATPLPAVQPENPVALAAGPLADLVGQSLAGFEAPVLADMRRQATELHERQGVSLETLEIALGDYAAEPPGGRRQLRLFIADANKKRNGHIRAGRDTKAAGWQAMKVPTDTERTNG